MTWRERLKPTIDFTSPTGQSFSAYWRGNDRTLDKKLGIFDYPKVDGSVVQDLGTAGNRYPLDFYFEGPDHDLTADQFYLACKERGSWLIDHPVRGLLRLNLISITEECQPIDSANVTRMKSEWIEGIERLPLPSARLRVPTEQALSDQLDSFETLAKYYSRQVPSSTSVENPVELKSVFQRVADTVRATLAPMKQKLAEINAQSDSEHRGITDALQSATLDIVSLGGQMQAFVTTPGMAEKDLTSRLNFYGGLLTALLPKDTKRPSRATLATRELAATACLVAMVDAVNDPDSTGLTDRDTAFATMQTLIDALSTVTTALDAGQAAYTETQMADRYFSQSESYASTCAMIHQAVAVLLRRSFDLAAARRFTLERDRAPIEIAITEGVDMDEFIAANNLKGYDILLLPAGREVVVYL